MAQFRWPSLRGMAKIYVLCFPIILKQPLTTLLEALSCTHALNTSRVYTRVDRALVASVNRLVDHCLLLC